MLLWKAAVKDNPPAAAIDITNFGGEITQDGAVMPSISDLQVAPAQLLDNVSSGCSAEKACNHTNCSCIVAGLTCTDYCTCAGGDHCCNPMTIRHDNGYEGDDDNEDCEEEKYH